MNNILYQLFSVQIISCNKICKNLLTLFIEVAYNKHKLLNVKKTQFSLTSEHNLSFFF